MNPGLPHREIEKKEEQKTYKRDRTGSALASKKFDRSAEVVRGRRRLGNHCPTEKAYVTSPTQRWILVQLLCKPDGESLHVVV